MLSLCLNDEVALEEQEINQDSNAIDEETQNIQIDFEDFKKLYERLYWRLFSSFFSYWGDTLIINIKIITFHYVKPKQKTE